MREGGVATVFSEITELKLKERDLIERGKTLEHTVNELEMVQAKLEEHASQAVEMAEALSTATAVADPANQSKSEIRAHPSHSPPTPPTAAPGASPAPARTGRTCNGSHPFGAHRNPWPDG